MVSSTLFATALGLVGMVCAAPTATSPIYPPKTTSADFRLVANVTANDLTPSINHFVLTSYHTGAGTSYAVLADNTTATTGRIFYINGTATDVRYGNSNVLSDGGSPLAPYGVSLKPVGTDGSQTVSINSGIGEAGVGLTQFPDPISELQAIGTGGFYACVNTLPEGPAVQVLSKAQGLATPAGCADITLLPQCSEGSGAEHPFGQITNCYEDVAGIDWTYYNTD